MSYFIEEVILCISNVLSGLKIYKFLLGPLVFTGC